MKAQPRVSGPLKLAVLALTVALLRAMPAYAAPPELLSYQGVLTLSDGTVVPDGAYTLRFGVYDTATPEGRKAFEQSLDVQVRDGLYNVILSNQGGWSLATAFEGSPRYMEVAITSAPAGSGLTPPITLAPRQQVASVPYALAAGNSVEASPPEWISPAPLLNNWTRYTDASGSSYSPFGYYKDASSRVYLRGLLTGGSGGTIAFVLPEGYRPEFTLILTCVTFPESHPPCQTEIRPDGGIRLYTENLATYFGLDGLSFRAEH